MSIENAERFIRFMEKDETLRKRAYDCGPEDFERVTAEAGASCSTYEIVCAIIRQQNAS